MLMTVQGWCVFWQFFYEAYEIYDERLMSQRHTANPIFRPRRTGKSYYNGFYVFYRRLA